MAIATILNQTSFAPVLTKINHLSAILKLNLLMIHSTQVTVWLTFCYRGLGSRHADATSKSTGIDGISSKMLKCASLVSSSTAHLLNNLFNLSITTGTFPAAWKVGRITPIPKGTNKLHPSGYRPISVLPVVTKLIECHVKDVIENLNFWSPAAQSLPDSGGLWLNALQYQLWSEL